MLQLVHPRQSPGRRPAAMGRCFPARSHPRFCVMSRTDRIFFSGCVVARGFAVRMGGRPCRMRLRAALLRDGKPCKRCQEKGRTHFSKSGKGPTIHVRCSFSTCDGAFGTASPDKAKALHISIECNESNKSMERIQPKNKTMGTAEFQKATSGWSPGRVIDLSATFCQEYHPIRLRGLQMPGRYGRRTGEQYD